MAERKVVPFDEFYYQLKLMYLFLLHVVLANNLNLIKRIRFKSKKSDLNQENRFF
jgi:hypothetical protein